MASFKKAGGKLYVVGIGPGAIEHMSQRALEVIRQCECVVGYTTYVGLIDGLVGGKEVYSTAMTQEVDRCNKAIALAAEGRSVAVVSSGDPGIYAMAGLILELLNGRRDIDVEIVPGIPALCASAARLGAPLMHDFACVSLSDRLTSWELIEKRLHAAADADFVIVLYNPKSKGRSTHINTARDIILRYRAEGTPVGIVKGAMRENEVVVITDLSRMLNHDIDMHTTVIVGNSQTLHINDFLVTPRGYKEKKEAGNK
ncbi:cobalt-precorrin-3B C(17)-methyltransferase [Candidatus Magnetobacterium bavaricum]|uniref:Cobalt-precorrin-3B C(17)-methyltransferase n=1 Tax=Candidatus Magnetobacterium bavaricum TaxID=29290 RepID=A0A0F3GLY9_9BACT|nr:cobalt-precorrin-3B C(17)-methyltransferase [Candidatus Magnetobacterium bavaricum]